MTEEKRQLREQIATHTYRHPTASASRPVPRRKMTDDAAQRVIHTQRAVAPSRLEAPRQRQVKQLDQVQPKAGEQFVHRRNQLYSARAVPQRPNTRLMPRTLAQSGVPASSGQLRSVRPLPQAGHSIVVRLYRFAVVACKGVATAFSGRFLASLPCWFLSFWVRTSH